MMAIVGIWEFIYDLGWGGLLGLVAVVCVYYYPVNTIPL
jgi:hypothetical protein